jgi:hypothetical protein
MFVPKTNVLSASEASMTTSQSDRGETVEQVQHFKRRLYSPVWLWIITHSLRLDEVLICDKEQA